MGQQEVYEILKNKRLAGHEDFYSVSQIRKFCIEKNDGITSVENTGRVVRRLNRWGILDKRTIDDVEKYRFKKKLFEDGSF